MADDLRHTLVVLSDALAMGRAHCSSLQIARACIAEGKAQGEEAKMLCSVIANSLRFHREQYSNWQVLATLPIAHMHIACSPSLLKHPPMSNT